MAGRCPKPTNLKVVQGTFRPSRAVQEPEPELFAEPPKPPKNLRGEYHKRARSEWVRVAKDLVELELLSSLDLVALECYCLAYERMTVAELALADGKGLTCTTPNGYAQQRPEVSILSVARKEVREFLVQFGMSPASRSRVASRKKKTGAIDPMERILGEG
jgi:P27 family predicted phage terminase small subunit